MIIHCEYEQLDKSFSDLVVTENVTTSEKPVERRFDIVVKNFPINPRENSHDTALKLNIDAMVKDGLKLQNINIKNVLRKPSQDENKPGIVMVSLDDSESKRKVMKSKKLLRDNMKYRDVYIENFLTNDKRILDANNSKLLKAVGKDTEFTSVAGHIRKRQNGRQQNENHNWNTNG